jgi:hypothetical protein
MSADKKLNLTALDAAQYRFPGRGIYRAGEQRRVDLQGFGKARDVAEMLFRQELRGRHPDSLVTTFDDTQRSEPRDHRLARADVTLDQPLHGAR